MLPEQSRRIIKEVPRSIAITVVSNVLADRLSAAVGGERAQYDAASDPLVDYDNHELIARINNMPFGTEWEAIRKVMSDIDRISTSFENAQVATIELMQISGQLLTAAGHVHNVILRGR